MKAIADRLAEAFAEWLHQRVRHEWYAPDEHLSAEDLVKENFRGIRPAFGYPGVPGSQREGEAPAAARDRRRSASGSTETFAMTPAAAVSGIYLHSPQAKYFAVGRIGRDQLDDYAERKGEPIADVERWLGQSLS